MKMRQILLLSIMMFMSWVCDGQNGGLNVQSVSVQSGLEVGSSSGYHTDISNFGIHLQPLTKEEINALTPQPGMLVYDTDSDIVKYCNGTVWKSFITPEPPNTVTYMGETYATVIIGEQVWMAENLNVGTMIAGGTAMTDNGTIEKYCYENDETYCETYGALYQWEEAMAYNLNEGSTGICPAGWHIPTSDEWEILINFAGGTDTAGGPLKETGLEHWDAPNEGATNATGFTALGAGIWDNLATDFSSLMGLSSFWASTPHPSSDVVAFSFGPYCDITSFITHIDNRITGLSIRCIMD